MTDLLIVGAGPAGLTAALYAARAGKSVVVLEGESIGGQIASSPRVENYPGVAQISGSAFADVLYEQATGFGAELELAAVSGITDGGKIKTVHTDAGDFQARAVILATGVRHRLLGMENEAELTGHGISYCPVCDGAFFKGKKVAVVGGGSAALTGALYLAGICAQVTLIHRRDTFRAEKSLTEEIRRQPNLNLQLCSRITALQGKKELTEITLTNTDGIVSELSLDGLFVAIGQEPNNSTFAGTVALDEAGYIRAGEDCLTSAEGIFAAGDCRTKNIRQLTTAAADGSTAALAACAYLR